MNRKLQKITLGILPFVCVLIIWQVVSDMGLVKPFFLPEPLRVFATIYTLFVNQGFGKDLLVSCFRIASGFLSASLLAVPLGVVIGMNRHAQSTTEPLIDFIRYTPIPAFIPLFILWFGIGEVEKIVVIMVSVFFQLVLMVANSVSGTPKELIDSAKTLGASRWQVISQVVFPLAKPKIYDDMRVSVGWAWSVLIMAELVGSTAGVGYVIIQAQRLLQTSTVLASIIITGAVGLLIDYFWKRLYPIFFPWSSKIEHHAES